MDKFKGFGSAMKGETSMLDPKEENKDSGYTPAENWDGLEWVGTRQWHEDQKRPQEQFESFGRLSAPLTERTHIRDELLRSVVEIFTIKNAFPENWQSLVNQGFFPPAGRFPNGVRIGCDNASREPIFEFESAEAEKMFFSEIRKSLEIDGKAESGEDLNEVRSAPESNEANFATTTSDFTFADLEDQSKGIWSSISLDDLPVRFAVAKRVQQRTGVRLSDPQISQAKSAGAMFIHLERPAKPTKLAEGLMSDDKLAELPNIRIADHRVTFVHREREIGRWKVIEEELNERGLPPLGRPDVQELGRNARSQ